MHFLANDLSRRGIGLTAGQIVSTGVILKYLPLGTAQVQARAPDGRRGFGRAIIAADTTSHLTVQLAETQAER